MKLRLEGTARYSCWGAWVRLLNSTKTFVETWYCQQRSTVFNTTGCLHLEPAVGRFYVRRIQSELIEKLRSFASYCFPDSWFSSLSGHQLYHHLAFQRVDGAWEAGNHMATANEFQPTSGTICRPRISPHQCKQRRRMCAILLISPITIDKQVIAKQNGSVLFSRQKKDVCHPFSSVSVFAVLKSGSFS